MLEELRKINQLSAVEDKIYFYQASFKKEEVVTLLKELKNNILYSFDQLIDITAIDYPSKERRFELIYAPPSLVMRFTNYRISFWSICGG